MIFKYLQNKYYLFLFKLTMKENPKLALDFYENWYPNIGIKVLEIGFSTVYAYKFYIIIHYNNSKNLYKSWNKFKKLKVFL